MSFDGWHTFDFVLLDFFFIDRMLNVGGILVLDDTQFPAIRKVCRFVRRNLAYSVVGVVGSNPILSLKRQLAVRLMRRSPFRRLLRPEVTIPDDSIGLSGHCIAFRKEADDGRTWNHFVEF